MFTSTETLEELIQQRDALDGELQEKKIISETLKKSLQLVCLYSSINCSIDKLSIIMCIYDFRCIHRFESALNMFQH